MKLNIRKLLLLLIACSILTACGIYKEIECPYQLKNLFMLTPQSGWAVTVDNEILFTNDGLNNFHVVKTVTDINKYTDGFMHGAFADTQTAYVAYFTEEDEKLTVEYTKNGGALWNKAYINDYGKICDMGSAFISLANNDCVYLLYCSTPSLGQMTKLLFCMENEEEGFIFVGDLTETIKGYPQGISFADSETGYIAVSYHGNGNYLYKTSDGALTWESTEIFSREKEVNYIDCYSPVFNPINKNNGVLVLKEVSDENILYKLFTTKNGGKSWISKGEITNNFVNYCFSQVKNQFYFIDNFGKVCSTYK